MNFRSHPLVNVNVRIENLEDLQSIRYGTESHRCKSIDGTSVVWYGEGFLPSFIYSLSCSFEVQLCFVSSDKLAQNLIIVYTLTADVLSSVGRILSNVNLLPTVTNKQVLNTCEKQTFMTKVC